MSTIEELIAEARRIAELSPDSDAGKCFTGLVAALEEVSAERDFYKREVEVADSMYRLARTRAEKAEAERDQLSAVVEQVRSVASGPWPYRRRGGGNDTAERVAALMDALNTAPSVALDRVKADAVRVAGKQHFKECVKNGVGAPTSGMDWMNQYANGIEKGESNDQ